MAKEWTITEFSKTDDIYCRYLKRKNDGAEITKAEMVRSGQRATGRTSDGSVAFHFGNLTTARAELGLPTLAEVGPMAHRPQKLIEFLKQRYPKALPQ